MSSIELTIKEVAIGKKSYRVAWELGNASALFVALPLEIRYEHPIPADVFFPLNNLFALMLPVLAKEYGTVRIRCSYSIAPQLKAYWQHTLQSLKIAPFQLDWITSENSAAPTVALPSVAPLNGRIGLLFGGGVESLFALSVLYRHQPILFAISGEHWMNNDAASDSFSIKNALEDELVAEFDLNLQRIQSNGLTLLRREPLYQNYYVSGLLFYWHCLPLCHQFGIHSLYKSSELEEALNFDYQDRSLHPAFLKEAILDGAALYLPLYNCYPKVQMMDELAKTPFLRFLYSCYYNTNTRWCGQCTKCYRISEYCARLGIDRKIIGMQDGIVGKRETGSISRHYWELADKLYGTQRWHEIQHIFIYYQRKYVSKLKKRFWRVLGDRGVARLKRLIGLGA